MSPCHLSGQAVGFCDGPWWWDFRTKSALYIYINCIYPRVTVTARIISKSLKIIDISAFANCSSLANIELSDMLRYIGTYAFADCKSLRSITLPQSVTTLEPCAFKGCAPLESITVPQALQNRVRRAFDEEVQSLMQYYWRTENEREKERVVRMPLLCRQCKLSRSSGENIWWLIVVDICYVTAAGNDAHPRPHSNMLLPLSDHLYDIPWPQ